MTTKPRKSGANPIKNKPQCLTVQSLDELDSKFLFSVCVQDSGLNVDTDTEDSIGAHTLIKGVISIEHAENWFRDGLEELADRHLPFRWAEISQAFRAKKYSSLHEFITSKIKDEDWRIPFEDHYINFVPFAVQFIDVGQIWKLTSLTTSPIYILDNNELKLDLNSPRTLSINTLDNRAIVSLNAKKSYIEPRTNFKSDSAKENNACNLQIPHNTGIEMWVSFRSQNFFEISSNNFQQYLTYLKRSTDTKPKQLAEDYRNIFGKTNWKIPRDLYCHIRCLASLPNTAHSLVTINRTLYGHPND